jgi:hypothetical protein
MNNNTPNPLDPLSASHTRQKLHRLSNQHKELMDELVGTDQMVIGSVFEVFKTCSKPNCCCRHGEKHGPFTAISYSLQGKIHHKMVRQEDKEAVDKDVHTYKTFQKKRKRLRQIQRELNEQLDALKNLQSREYQ